jgi:hypothetical protein
MFCFTPNKEINSACKSLRDKFNKLVQLRVLSLGFKTKSGLVKAHTEIFGHINVS